MKRKILLTLLSFVSLWAFADGYTDVTELLIGNSKFKTVSSGWWDSSTGWSTDISGGNLRVLSNTGGNDIAPGECTSQPNSLERWTSSSFPNGKRILYKELSLPNGTYRLHIAAQAANLNASGKPNTDSVYVFANNAKAKVTNAKALKYYDVDETVTTGKLAIGIATGRNNQCNYANIADVTLLIANGTTDCSLTIDSLNNLTSKFGESDDKISYLISAMQSGSDYQKIKAFTKTEDAVKEYSLKHASEANPVDMTSAIQNASCTENYGWSRNSADAAANYNTNNSEFNNSLYSGMCIESWYWSPVKNADIIWQSLAGLMPGKYKVRALCTGQVYNDNTHKGQCREGLYFFAGDKRIAIDSPTWKEYELEFEIGAGESINVGITADGDNLNDWAGITQVELSLTGIGTAEEIFLSDDYDCNALQSDTYADVTLHMQMRKGDFVTLCLPFDMPLSTARKYFTSISSISNATAIGNEIGVESNDVDYMEAGETYIVKAAQDIDGTIFLPGTMLHTALPTTENIGIAKVKGSYRSSLSNTEDFTLRKNDATRLYKPAVNSTLKAFSARITK